MEKMDKLNVGQQDNDFKKAKWTEIYIFLKIIS